jgi:DNA-binding response OmpR family regulator
MDQKKKKILIIDDDADLREMYADVFRADNYDVLEAADGVEGLDMATKEMPDIIFTGIIMPRMDGFTMMESLKKTVMTSKIPVVISSHMGREEDRKRADELGAKDFIVKGYTKPGEIVERIGVLLAAGDNSYDVDFNQESLDVRRLGKELGFPEKFECPQCGEKMQLRLKLTNREDRIFEARFLCGVCGNASNR